MNPIQASLPTFPTNFIPPTTQEGWLELAKGHRIRVEEPSQASKEIADDLQFRSHITAKLRNFFINTLRDQSLDLQNATNALSENTAVMRIWHLIQGNPELRVAFFSEAASSLGDKNMILYLMKNGFFTPANYHFSDGSWTDVIVGNDFKFSNWNEKLQRDFIHLLADFITASPNHSINSNNPSATAILDATKRYSQITGRYDLYAIFAKRFGLEKSEKVV